jgi:hypothetical protein
VVSVFHLFGYNRAIKRKVIKRMRKIMVVLVLMVVTCVFAQDHRDVAVGGEMLIRLRVGIGNLSLDERADRIDERIVRVLSLRNLRASDVVMKQKGDNYEIRVRGILLVVATPEDAEATKMNVKKLAEQWTNTFKKKLPLLNVQPTREGR